MESINVVYSPSSGDPTVLPQDKNAVCDGGADGWQFTDGPDQKIRLCGPMCDAIRGDPGARVDVVLGCPVVTVI